MKYWYMGNDFLFPILYNIELIKIFLTYCLQVTIVLSVLAVGHISILNKKK